MPVAAVPVNEGILKLSDCVMFNLSVSDIGTYPNKNCIAYQLWCRPEGVDPDYAVSEVMVLCPINLEAVTVDFAQDIKDLLDTTVIGSSNAKDTQDYLFKKDFFVKYGEVTYIDADCSGTTYELDLETDAITVLNSYWQHYQDVFPQTSWFMLTDMPSHFTLKKGSRDWVWVYGSTTVTMSIYRSNGLPPIGQEYEISGVTAVGIGDLNYFDTVEDVKRVEFTIGNPIGANQQFTVCYRDCNCLIDHLLFFQEPKGSIKQAYFLECVEEVIIEKEGQVICNSLGCQTSMGDAISLYGEKYMKSKLWKRLTFRSRPRPDKVTQKFLDAFAMSSRYFVDVITDDGVIRQLGFIVENSSILVYDEDDFELIITGHISAELLSH